MFKANFRMIRSEACFQSSDLHAICPSRQGEFHIWIIWGGCTSLFSALGFLSLFLSCLSFCGPATFEGLTRPSSVACSHLGPDRGWMSLRRQTSPGSLSTGRMSSWLGWGPAALAWQAGRLSFLPHRKVDLNEWVTSGLSPRCCALLLWSSWVLVFSLYFPRRTALVEWFTSGPAGC